MLGRKPSVERSLLPVDEVERLLSELADEEDGVLSAPLHYLVESCAVANFHGILETAVSSGHCTLREGVLLTCRKSSLRASRELAWALTGVLLNFSEVYISTRL
jgi:hypothetical protein